MAVKHFHAHWLPQAPAGPNVTPRGVNTGETVGAVTVTQIDPAIVLVGSSNNTGNVTSLALTVPAGSVGDVLLLFLATATTQAWSTPAGLTPGYISRNGGGLTTAMYYRVVQAGDPTSYTFTHTTTATSAGVCARYSGVDQTNPIRFWSNALTDAFTNGTTAPLPTVQNVGSTDHCVALVAAVSAANNVTTTIAAPVGWTQRQSVTSNVSTNVSAGVMLCDKTAGTDTPSATGFSGVYVAETVCLADAAAPAAVVTRNAPSFRSASTAAVPASSASLVVNAPSGVSDGDLLIACASSTSQNALTLTGNWIPLEMESAALNGGATIDNSGKVWFRIANSEPANYTLGAPVATKLSIAVVSYSVPDSVIPIRTVSSTYAATAATTSPSRPALPYVQTTDLIVACYTAGSDVSGSSNTITPPASPWVTRANVSTAVASTFNCGVAVVDQFGASTTPTATASASSGWNVFSIAAVGLAGLTVTPAGISDAQFVGSPAVAQVVSPTGVSSAVAAGSPAAIQVVAPAGTSSSEAAGVAAAGPSLTPAGVPSEQRAGVISTVLGLAPAGVASGGTLGATAVSAAASVAPQGVASGEAPGTPTVAVVSVIAPLGIETGEASGSASVTGGLLLAPAGVGPAERFGTATVGLATAPAGIPSSEQLGATTVTTTTAVTVAGVPTGGTLGAATTTPGTVTLAPAGIPTAGATGSAAVSITLAPASIGTGEQLGAPSTSLTVAPTGTPSSETLGATAVTTAIAVSPAGIRTGEQSGTATTATGAITITPAGTSTSQALGSAAITPGTATVSPASVPTGETLGVAAAGLLIAPAGAASTEVPGSATATLVTAPAGIPGAETPGSNSVSVTIAPVGVGTGEQFGGPTVAVGNIAITPWGIGSGQALGAVTVTALAVTIATAGIPSEATPGAAVVAFAVTPTGTVSGEAVGAVTVIVGAVTLNPAGIPSDELVGAHRAVLGLPIDPAGIGTVETLGQILRIRYVFVPWPPHVTKATIF